MLTRAQKEEQVAELHEKFARATSVVVAEYRGLSVQASEKLRKQFRAEGAGQYEYRVTKNSLLRRAAEGSDVAAVIDHFKGPTAVAISYGDPVRMAKILVDYAKQNEIFQIRGGVLDGKAIQKADIATLATLPNLDQLRGTLVGLLQAPAQQLVRLLAAPGAQLARVVEARRKLLEETGAGA
jgi:large subunit ribosomal protein L10